MVARIFKEFKILISIFVIGAARGCGWQNIYTIINLGAYYLVGIPCAVLFAFICSYGGMVSFSVKMSISFTSIQGN